MRQRLEAFFVAIDQVWSLPHQEKVRLGIIGTTALMLQTDYVRDSKQYTLGTKDSDVIHISRQEDKAVEEYLKGLAGPSSDICDEFELYLDVVGTWLPFLPQEPIYHALESLNTKLQHLEIAVVDVVDVVVSKIGRKFPDQARKIGWRQEDLDDIRAMVARQLVDPDRLVERFRKAVDWFICTPRRKQIEVYIHRLNDVQRDMLEVDEIPLDAFDLPDWES